MQEALARLEARIRAIEGRPPVARCTVASGVPALDAAVGGLPCPALVEVVGPPGSGRVRLALAWAAARIAEGERVAWVDPERLLYPPAAQAFGVQLERLLVVRPDALQTVWATEQLVRSGCFGLVVLATGCDGRRVGARLQAATRHGRSVLAVLSERTERALPAELRLQVQGGVARVQRQRGGHVGQAVAVPCAPVDPWEGAAWAG